MRVDRPSVTSPIGAEPQIDSVMFFVEEDPDYDFLHKDLSSSETLPPLPTASSLPPALPEKRRRSNTGNTELPVSVSLHLSICV